MSSRYSGQAHLREMRTSLFDTPSRMSSPYEDIPSAKFDQQMMSTLESQNGEEYDSMSAKIGQLKSLGDLMGQQINKSLKLSDELTDSLDKGTMGVKNTFNRMMVMSKRAGVGWRAWLLVFLVVFLFFFWVWLF